MKTPTTKNSLAKGKLLKTYKTTTFSKMLLVKAEIKQHKGNV